MKQLYAPWRKNYIKGNGNKGDVCVFCQQQKESNDAKNFIIKRFQHCFAMLNIFPYNAGHILIIPYEHQPSLEQLLPEARAEMMEITAQSITIFKKILKAEGINVGINIGGKSAGGSIPEHLHLHVLPRWLGDTNFLITLAETKQISLDLHEIYQKLHEAFQNTSSK